MADPKDYAKMEAFMHSLCNRWEWTEAERTLFQSKAVQTYAANVELLSTMTPRQYFEAFPEWTGRIEQALKLVETEQAALAEAATEADEVKKLRAEMDDLKAKVVELTKPTDAVSTTPIPGV